ncbi:NAD(P)H-dependent oxidoreductase [Neomegalonema sp.]|uniref:NAD(P)H-dependent oxidoreductase n=1 Tax=Neomegalonema sp. TaxID=2039713 RepID=UPI0026118831|nr:NAD(P)H-dependent oxidoreductase [Neomegalonema sp.]MDD2869341.1 NAD(P)H-dependent oxidoreductase [Neomegalonema sp.]
MASEKTIVVVNGSPNAASRTGHLLDRLAEAALRRVKGRVERVNLSENRALLTRFSREELSAAEEAVFRRVETADLLIVGAPVYRGSYPGAFKHLFDLVDRDALAGKVVLLSATGGAPLHGLVGEHQFRPLFGFFRAVTVPNFVFATEGEIDALRVSDSLAERVERAAEEAAFLLEASLSARRASRPAVALSA